MASDKTVKLTDEANGKQAELSILTPTYGNSVVDLRGLTASTGYFTHDPGYTSTSACRSAITFIDGDEGILLYRGYPIEQLAEKSNFLEVCYLLLFGELPNEQQWEDFRSTIYSHTMIHEGLRTIIQGYEVGLLWRWQFLVRLRESGLGSAVSRILCSASRSR